MALAMALCNQDQVGGFGIFRLENRAKQERDGNTTGIHHAAPAATPVELCPAKAVATGSCDVVQ